MAVKDIEEARRAVQFIDVPPALGVPVTRPRRNGD
jgi:hypothetical protein